MEIETWMCDKCQATLELGQVWYRHQAKHVAPLTGLTTQATHVLIDAADHVDRGSYPRGPAGACARAGTPAPYLSRPGKGLGMLNLETPDELAGALADMLGLYNQGLLFEGLTSKETRTMEKTGNFDKHHADDCVCRMCWCGGSPAYPPVRGQRGLAGAGRQRWCNPPAEARQLYTRSTVVKRRISGADYSAGWRTIQIRRRP
jgi:hypothetical protein